MRHIVLIFLLLPMLLWAQYERPGSTSAQFLKIGVSARAAGMSNAFISAVEGAEAAYYNPAALVGIKRIGLAFTHTCWFAGINHEFAALGYNLGHNSVLAFSVTALYTDAMKVRTPLQPDGTGATFYAGSNRFGLSFARYLTNHVSFGSTVNFINIYLDKGFSKNGITVDVAVLYRTNYHGFRFGMMISNFGSSIKFVNESYPPPTTFTFGLNFNPVELKTQRVMFSIAAEKPNDGKPIGKSGVEYTVKNHLFLRAGYRLNSEVETFSFGFGFKLNIHNWPAQFDYAYSDFSELGATHRFGLNLNWE
ncbi:MAG: PorV/PorQ family protein [Caldisericaceae bacterium]|nr:PorV/PorQ family protein [Caldisericaceae bacterium]